MPEVCGEPHPTIPDVHCEKTRPCYLVHLNHSISPPDWDGAPPPTTKSRRVEVDKLSERIKREKFTGPPTVDAPGVKLHAQPHDTEVKAALRVLPRTGTQRRRVYDALRVAGDRGLTDEEMQVSLEMNPSTQRPRRGELVDGGFVADSGQQRKVASGDDAIVWCLTPETSF